MSPDGADLAAPDPPRRPGVPAAAGAPGARLATSQLRRMRRIVDAAVDLAEGGGFEAVRLRDVADRSGVALGTLYKYFRSKEDLLLFSLHEQVDGLELALVARPAQGDSPLLRVVDFFERSTRGLIGKPQLARAVVRAMAAGDADTSLKIAALHLRMSRLIVAANDGRAPDLAAPLKVPPGETREDQVATALILVWFSALVGWAVGLHTADAIAEHIRSAAALMLGHSGEVDP